MFQEELYRKPAEPLNAEVEPEGNPWLPIVGGIAGALAGRTAVGKLVRAISKKEVPLASKVGKVYQATPNVRGYEKSGYTDFQLLPSNKVIIHDAYVDQEARGRGLATDMLRQIEKKFPDSEKWTAAVSPEMSGLSKKLGFELVAKPGMRRRLPDDIPDEVRYPNAEIWKKGSPRPSRFPEFGSDFSETPERLHETLIGALYNGRQSLGKVLEPHGGKGAMIKSLLKAGAGTVDTFELDPARRKFLSKLTNVNVLGDNFLANGGGWDSILMNPPFSKGQAIDHVVHGYKNLNPGGTMVAIVPSRQWYPNRTRNVAFQEWFESVGGDVLGQASFKTGHKGRIGTVILQVNKPGV